MEHGPLPSYRPRTALVVDDSRAIRALLRQALQQHAFEVVEAEHGRDALAALARTGVPALALVDWNMPVMDGLELIALLRADRRYDEMHIVMVTSESEPAEIERALAAGADEYIIKPLSPEVLMDRVLRLQRMVAR